MIAQDLVVTWEDAYRRYGHAVGSDVTETSRAVAGAWHELAACAELPWWLSAAVRSAAQAFEHQAEAWAGQAEGSEDEEGEDVYGGQVRLPAQQRRDSCACAHTPPVVQITA